jgi:hypothetical protein
LPSDRLRKTVLLDAEAVSALSDSRNRKHRTVLAWAELGARRNRRQPGMITVVVPTSVRVESGWNRQDARASLINRLPIRDDALDPSGADRAAHINAALYVGVADAHIGVIIEKQPALTC